MASDDLPSATPSMDDYRRTMERATGASAVLAATHANDDPDIAARSAQLGAATGVPSNIIHLDPKGFEERLKAQVTQQVVSSNPSLARYAQLDDMAAIVSNDDWTVLDSLSKGLHSLREASDVLTQPFQKAIDEGAEDFKEGIGIEPLTSFADVARQRHPKTIQDFINVGAEALGTNVLESVMRVGSGVFGGLSGAAGGLAKSFTGSEGLGRDVKALTEYEMLKPEQMPGGPWLMAGHEPPAGVSKDLDKSKAERNEILLKGLEEVTSYGQANSKTLPRSPEHYRQFVQQELADRSIYVSGDAVSALYGDKVPAPGDGLLGWVPNIASQHLAAVVDGSDIVVPQAMWVAHIDPQLMQQLSDNIRTYSGGITRTEATVERPQVPPPPMPTKATLVPAAKLPDGTVRSGRLGQVHGDLFNEEEMHGKEGEDRALIDGAEMGFTTPDGTFLDRRQAMKYVEANEPHMGEPGGKLEALGYFEKSQAVAASANAVAQVRAAGGLEPVFRSTTTAFHGTPYDIERFDLSKVGTGEGIQAFGHGLYFAESRGTAKYYRDTVTDAKNSELGKNAFADLKRKYAGDYIAQAGASQLWASNFDLEKALKAVKDTPVTPKIKEWMSEHADEVQQHVGKLYKVELGFDKDALIDLDKRLSEQTPVIQEKLQRLVGEDKWEGIKDKNTLATVKGSLFGNNPQEVSARLKDAGIPGSKYLNRESRHQGEGLHNFVVFDDTKVNIVHRPQSVGAARSDHPMIIGLDTIDPKAVGLPEGHWQKLQELAQVQYEEDMSIAQRRAERQQKREQTAEWKANRAEVLKEVEADTRAMPHVAADLFIGSGELNGEKLQQRFTLREADLTPEQKATLPDHYVSKNGLPVDAVATHFGFGSGDSLIEALGWHHGLKNGRSAQEMFRNMVKAETDRRMEQRYGDLPSNILTAAHDQALSDTTLNLVTQEYQGAAMSAGAEVLTDAHIKAEAKRIADGVINKDVDSRKKLAEVSRHYSDAIKGLLGNDPQLAIMALQRRAIGAHVAKELMAREEAMKKFAKLADSYTGRWDPTKAPGQKIAPEWSLMIRNILGKLGLKNGMTPAWMAQEMANSRFTGLADFVEKVEKESALVELHLPIPDFLYEDKVKPLKEMTGDEFRAAADAVTMMDHIGRADQKADVNGKKVEKDKWVAQAKAQLEKKFPALPSDRKVGPAGTLAAASTSVETLFQRFDGRDPHGLFTRTFIYPMAEGENFKNRVERETAKEYQKLGEIRDKDKLLESPIIDPSTGKPWVGFTRKHLHAVISNMGNEYNWKIANKGWGTDPNLMWKWVESVTDADDIRHGQGLGNIFGGIKPRIDTVDRNVYGVASESVVPRPFTMHGEQFDGWYHPIIPNKVLSRYVNKLPELKETQGEFWPSVYNKFLKKRTGAVQFIDPTYDAIPSRLMQQIHYLAMHEPVMNVARLIRDDRFRRAVTTHYGKEYMEAIDHWVQSAAGEASINSGMMAQATKWSGIMRQNVMNTLIGVNMGTVEKHGPTAFMYSLKELAPKTVVAGIPSFLHVTAEVAPGLFKHTVMDLFGRSPELGDSNFDFVLKNSEEIQRRVRNYQDTLLGTQQTFESGRSLRNVIFEYGAKPVAFSDMLSAAPLWLARYRQEMALHGDHGLAIQAADLSVRRAHGSTAVTSRPMIATGNNPVTPWFTSLYGFMGTSLNRRIELLHDVNDFWRLGMKGEINTAAKMLPQIASSLAVYIVWTGVVEELVTGQFTEDHRGPIEKSASFVFTSLANAIIGLRDFVNSIERGGGSVGLLSTPPADVARVLRDVKIDKTMEGKYNPLAKQNAGKLIQDTCTLIGDFSGYCPKHVGAIIRYGIDAYDGMQKPKDATDIYRGLMTGTQKLYQRR